MKELGVPAGKDSYKDYEEHVQRVIEREGFQPEYGTIRKGQAIVWSANLLHGGSPQRDKERSRHSQVTHYFFEGTRVYTPLMNEGDHVFWHYPDWIREPVRVSIWLKDTFLRDTAVNSLMGMLTSPKLMAPLHMARGMPGSIPCRSAN